MAFLLSIKHHIIKSRKPILHKFSIFESSSSVLYLHVSWQVVITWYQEEHKLDYFAQYVPQISFPPDPIHPPPSPNLMIERDVIQPQLSLLFEDPEVISVPNLQHVFKLPVFDPS